MAYFKLDSSIFSTVKHLTVEESGQLFNTILSFVNGVESPAQSKTILVAFEPIKNLIIADREKNKSISKERSKAGQKSGQMRAKKVVKKEKELIPETEPSEVRRIEVRDLVIQIKEKAYDKEVFDTFDKLKVHFELNYLPDSPAKVLKWLAEIEKLNRIDGHSYDKIIEVVKWGRNHNFWGNQFFTIMKLRKTNDEGVKFFDRFEKQMNERAGSSKKEEVVKNNEPLSDWFKDKFSKK